MYKHFVIRIAQECVVYKLKDLVKVFMYLLMLAIININSKVADIRLKEVFQRLCRIYNVRNTNSVNDSSIS